MPSDLSSKTVLVVTHSLFLELAVRLARDFKKVYFWTPESGRPFPTMNSGMVGYGLEGIERVDSVFGEHFEEIDLFVFPDLYQADLQVYLESIGKRVWGGRHGEDLEIQRQLCKRLMEKVGLPVQPWGVVKGMTALRDLLKKKENQHVKINRWRGVTESFFSPNYGTVEMKLDQLEHDLGGFKEMLDFIHEDNLPDKVEIGIDAYCIDGEYPTKTLIGIECKDCGYVGQMVDWAKIPEPLRRWNEAMAPYFNKTGYRGFLSNEIRIGKDKVPYMIDATTRAPSPPNELWQELYTNISEIIWEGAAGNCIDPEPAAKFGIQVVLKSEWARGHWQPVQFPPEFRRNVKLFDSVLIDGNRFVVPQDEHVVEIGSVVGWGDTIESAMEMAKEAGESIEGYGIKFSMGAVDSVNQEIDKIEEIGVSPFNLAKEPAQK